MTKGKLKAVVIIIVALLIISVVCSYLINKDSGTQDAEPDSSSRVSIVSADGEQTYNSDTNTQVSDGSGSTYTGTGSGTGGSTSTGSGTAAAATPTPNLGTVSTPSGTNDSSTADAQPVATTQDSTYTGDGTGVDSTLGTITIPETETVPEENFGRSLGSESYYSSISDDIVLVATVSAQTYSATQVQVTVTVSVQSASLYCISTPVNISLNDTFVECYSNAVQYTGGTTTTELTSQTFLVDVGDGENITLPVQVIWEFNGTYAGQSIDSFECGGSFAIVRA